MAAPATKHSTARLLDVILFDVERYQRYRKKTDAYSKRANKLRVKIFEALDRIPSDDFALYREKIERISKRLNKT